MPTDLAQTAKGRQAIPQSVGGVSGGGGVGDVGSILDQLRSGQLGAEQFLALLALLSGGPMPGGGPGMAQGGPQGPPMPPQGPGAAMGPGGPMPPGAGGGRSPIEEALMAGGR